MVIGVAGNPAIFGAIGHDGSERLIVYPAMLWTLAFGGHLMLEAPYSTPISVRPKRHDGRGGSAARRW